MLLMSSGSMFSAHLRNLRFSNETRLTQPPLQFFIFREPDSQIAQLLWIDFRRRLRHEVHTAVILRESHHVANTLFAADQHDQTIEAERDSAMRRRAQPKRTK